MIERNGGTLPGPNGAHLLSFAVPSINSFHYSIGQMPDYINEEAAILLLQHGADPVYGA